VAQTKHQRTEQTRTPIQPGYETRERARLAELQLENSRLRRLATDFLLENADSDEVAQAFRDDVARFSDMMSLGVRCLAGG
jgi:hypothetical protein